MLACHGRSVAFDAERLQFRTMNKIEIYTTATCPYCVAAKNFLVEKGLSYEEVRVDRERERLGEMLSRSGQRRSVPQIFVNGHHVGGYDELVSLDRAGGLAPLLEPG
jgi:glutaredoxin 3